MLQLLCDYTSTRVEMLDTARLHKDRYLQAADVVNAKAVSHDKAICKRKGSALVVRRVQVLVSGWATLVHASLTAGGRPLVHGAEHC